jgi:hypothetical protein
MNNARPMFRFQGDVWAASLDWPAILLWSNEKNALGAKRALG